MPWSKKIAPHGRGHFGTAEACDSVVQQDVGDDARCHGDQDVPAVGTAHPAVSMGRRSQVVVAVIVDIDAPFDVDHAATIIVSAVALVPAVVTTVVIVVMIIVVTMAIVIVIVIVIVVTVTMTAVVLVLGGDRHRREENEADQQGGQQAFHGFPKVFGWRCHPMTPPPFVSAANKKH